MVFLYEYHIVYLLNMFNLSATELSLLKKLDTPDKIQNYLDSLSFNFETEGETCMSPRRVLQEQKAHCIEGAMLAAVALWLQGEPPLLLNLKVDTKDVDHIVVLFKRNGYYGALSKTNHAVLRYRDPVYKTLRELAMSYFHEYFLLTDGRKTMRGYSKPIHMGRFGKKWVTANVDLWNIAETIYDSKHTSVIPKGNESYIRKATNLERQAAGIPKDK